MFGLAATGCPRARKVIDTDSLSDKPPRIFVLFRHSGDALLTG
jgi:hypothetical protein